MIQMAVIPMSKDNIKSEVRKKYGEIAKTGSSCCSCGSAATSKQMGYTDEDLKNIPDEANLGLGCGNPVALASLRKGETVVDLGSGAGIDCFLAAKKVGRDGQVIGVDMTHEMLERARANAKKNGYKNVEFRLGEIENMPVADNTADAIISNCVINLSPDKPRVFKEAYRVLKPCGRLMVSDIVVTKTLPKEMRESVAAYVGCLAGAMKKEEYLKAVKSAGFTDVKVVAESQYPLEFVLDDPNLQVILKDLKISKAEAKKLANSVLSIKVTGFKPCGCGH